MTILRRVPKAWLIGLTAAACAAAMVITLLVWNGQSGPSAAVRNVSGNFRACLMADSADTADAQAAQAAWAGLQRAAATGRVNAERLPLAATAPEAALPYFNGAVQQHCGLIVSAGETLRPAVEAAASANSGQRFVLVGAVSSLTNVTGVVESDAGRIADAVYTDTMSAAH